MLMDLKLALVRQGIRQTRMAVALGWDPAKLSRIVNGIVEPKQEDRLAISRFLNLPEESLFGAHRDTNDGRGLDMATKQRLYTGTFVCPSCQARYEIEHLSEGEATCDECGTQLEADDYDEDDE